MIAAATLAIGCAPPPAQAGTYEVTACDAAGGANNSWHAVTNSPSLTTAYTDCPASGDPNKGIIARNAVNPTPGAGAGGPIYARMQFDAPAGTSIVGMTATYDFIRSDHRWETALSNGSTTIRGCVIGGLDGCGLSGAGEWISVPAGSTSLYIDVYCVDTGCPLNSNDATHNYVSARARITSASVRLEDDSAPTITSVSGGLWTDGWKAGPQPLSVDASDNSGISATNLLLNGTKLASDGHVCDNTQTVPCPNGTDTFNVNTAAIPDGSYPLTIQTSDAAGNPTSATRTLLVDNSPPGPPQGLQVDGGEDWQAKDTFTLHWVNPYVGLAPLAGVNWKICPAAGAQTCVTGSKDGDSVATLPDLPVPHDGDWVGTVWLRDAAGNNTSNNGIAVHLRADTVAPTVVFSPTSPADPTRVVLQAADQTSGLGSGSIDYKPTGGTTWTSVPAQVDGGQLVANLPDETMADGTYDLRGVAVDRAGNEKSTSTLADGTPMTVTLPLRSPTHLVGGRLQTRHRHGKRVRYLATRLRLRYSTRTRLQGRLADKDHKSMPGTPISVTQLVDGDAQNWQPVRTITTTPSGAFQFRTAERGPSRTIRLRYEGTPTVRPSQVDVHLSVRASSTIHVSRRRVRRRHATRFSGTLRGGHVPPGKLVQLQVLVRGHWQTFANARAKANGGWTYVYKFTGAAARNRFRVRVPAQPGYPYAAGNSATVAVTVRG